MPFPDPDPDTEAEGETLTAPLVAASVDASAEGASDAVPPEDGTGATEADGVDSTDPAEPLAAEAGPPDGLTASSGAERVPPCLPRWSPP
ncbi:hypothetical protein G9272_28615 [Streptomyces asoensis]|uniref:Uncharacterized protein n=1 Tax=Streptomyces asoensis TaxID=249586 RepID=A0A6M4WWQ4_9ACTN|nr:hypothetical protein [Streptomyces asoensis]QJT03755.1 hypothetical protein G9272_28615 [Streptomyces asoensis]